MLKAHSLLYAVYVCLIVSILCGALLYFSTLYNQLNLYYNVHENLYIQNQSAVNFALGSSVSEDNILQQDTTEIKSEIERRPYGLLNLLIVKSIAKSDTVVSAHIVGKNATDKNCLYISSISKPLSYSGNVKLIGEKKLPSPSINQVYTIIETNSLVSSGAIGQSESILPTINPIYKHIFDASLTKLQSLKNIEKSNKTYYNSFLNPAIEIELSSPILDEITIKGNFVLYSKDSLQVNKNAILEDVILKSPKIHFMEGFKGTVQAFATFNLKVDKAVELNYPSAVCVFNPNNSKSELFIDENTKIFGAVVLFGNPISAIDDNLIIVNKKALLVGDLYCFGKLMLEGTVYGSVYTNRVFHKTKTSMYENCLINSEIDVSKRPSYFISLPLFENTTNSTYGIYKKVQ